MINYIHTVLVGHLFADFQNSGIDQPLSNCGHATTHGLRRVLLVLGSLSFFYAYCAAGYGRLKDFTQRVLNRCVVLDVSMTLTPSHYNECPMLYDMFLVCWGPATVLPRRNLLLHDLITHVLLRSLQYGIVMMVFIDAFVYAHQQHRRSIENPGNLADCMKSRNRFMTAIPLLTFTRTRQHASQDTFLRSHIGVRLPKPKPDIRIFPT